MPAAVLAVLGALSGGVLGAPKADALLFVDEEVAVGYAPEGPAGERTSTFVSTLRPGVALGLTWRRSTLELNLGPRIYYRTPNLSGLDRPLVLMEGGARHTHAIAPRLSWSTRVAAQYGEVEYSSAGLVFDAPTSRPEEDPVLSSLDVGGESGFAWTATRRYQLSFGAALAYTRPLGELEESSFRTTTSSGGDVSHRFRIDRRSTFSAPGTFRYYSVQGERDWSTVTQSFGYDRMLTRRATISASVGATAVRRTDEAALVHPRASLVLERVVHETSRTRLANRLAVSVDATFDPLIGEVYPVAGAEASLSSTFGAAWSASVSASAFTPVTREPVTADGVDTTAGAGVSVRHRLSEYWSIEFGARQSTRATHLATAPFTLSAGETWFFLRLSFAFGSRAAASATP